MRTRGIRIIALVLTLLSVLVCLPPTASAASLDYENTYVNTGDQRADIVGIALTQVGYRESGNNDTKYGDWYGMPNNPWCAMFISWCAYRADVSGSILRQSALASPRSDGFNIPYYSGSSYTPKPGDLAFIQSFSHVGIVVKVEDDYFYSVEGNTNDNGSSEGIGVFLRKRKINGYVYFGVPAYKGGGDHTYVRGHDQAHPHKNYYACSDCGDKYYTGSNAFVGGCKSCSSCDCSADYADYYVCTAGTSASIYSGHGTSYKRLLRIPAGTKVYVHSASGKGTNDWAHVEYDNVIGHMQMRYLQPYIPAPQSPEVKATGQGYCQGDTAKFTWEAVEHALEYRVEVYRDGAKITDVKVGTATEYTLEDMAPGAYELRVTASNKTGDSQPGVCQITVLQTFTVSYDTQGGSPAPEAQIKRPGEALALSTVVPVREGYTFLGWSDDSQQNLAVYKPGSSLTADGDITLYAVWKDNTATPERVEIVQTPARTIFVLQEALDTQGMILRLTYSDGSGELVTDGYTTEGYNSENLGTVTVTVLHSGLRDTYTVEILEYIPGDIDKDGFVTREDVVQLLWHISFQDLYPIDVPADFTGEGNVDKADVLQLLWHITFPALYPLM